MSARPKYEDDQLFRFHWRGTGKPDEGYGRDASDAFTRLGYSSGALGALDYWERIEVEADDALSEACS